MANIILLLIPTFPTFRFLPYRRRGRKHRHLVFPFLHLLDTLNSHQDNAKDVSFLLLLALAITHDRFGKSLQIMEPQQRRFTLLLVLLPVQVQSVRYEDVEIILLTEHGQITIFDADHAIILLPKAQLQSGLQSPRYEFLNQHRPAYRYLHLDVLDDDLPYDAVQSQFRRPRTVEEIRILVELIADL